jgi:hypothetical protein
VIRIAPIGVEEKPASHSSGYRVQPIERVYKKLSIAKWLITAVCAMRYALSV